MIGYKAFDKDLKCRGFQYEVGKTYEMDGVIALCERGYHFCKNISDCFRYYDEQSNARFAKIEALGEVIQADDDSKCVTDKIKILEEIPREEAVRMSNSGEWNSGNWNSGDWNSGNRNSGNRNSGDWNSGNMNSGGWNSGNRNSGGWNSGGWNSGNRNSGGWNSGNRNSGNWNSGDKNSGDKNSGDKNSGNWNSGDWNSGDWNSGNWNSGNWNSGNRNSGNRNSGDWNSGDWNSGDWNSGDWNSGDWNISSYNNGCFMSVKPMIMMFNKPTEWTIEDWWSSKARDVMQNCPVDYVDTRWVFESNMTEYEKIEHPEYETTVGYLEIVKHKADCQTWWDGLSADDKYTVMSLPNFDPDVFYECTGIRVKMEGEG